MTLSFILLFTASIFFEIAVDPENERQERQACILILVLFAIFVALLTLKVFS